MNRMLKRNSNVELLRIVAMWCIVAHHYVVHNADQFDSSSSNVVDTIMIDVFFRNFGRIATGVFLLVSIWYLCARYITLYDIGRRIWLLEREILTYGILVLIYQIPWSEGDLSIQSIANALLPLYTGSWWYATCYALLLVFVPFLFEGLRALRSEQHLQLVIVSLVVVGLVRFIPYCGWGGSLGGGIFIDFLMLSIVISYIRWHLSMEQLRQHRTFLVLLSFGSIMVLVASYYLSKLHIRFIGSIAANFLNAYFTFPGFILSVIIEVTVLICAVTAKERHVLFINKIAATTFGVYLISDSVPMRTLFWHDVFPMSWQVVGWSKTVSLIIAVTSVFAFCSLIDICRTWIFRLTCDKHPGKVYDACIAFIARKIRVK